MTTPQQVQVKCPRCMVCREVAVVEMTLAQYQVLVGPGRPFVQEIFPDWTADQREMLISGTHPACWVALYGDEDEDIPTYAVWYASAGCLPDSDGPDFVGTYKECNAYIEDQVALGVPATGYPSDTTHNLYGFTIEAYDDPEEES